MKPTAICKLLTDLLGMTSNRVYSDWHVTWHTHLCWAQSNIYFHLFVHIIYLSVNGECFLSIDQNEILKNLKWADIVQYPDKFVSVFRTRQTRISTRFSSAQTTSLTSATDLWAYTHAVSLTQLTTMLHGKHLGVCLVILAMSICSVDAGRQTQLLLSPFVFWIYFISKTVSL